MMKIQEIAKGVKFENSASVTQALEQVRNVPEHELHYYLVCRDTLQSTALETRQIIALAQVEWERRKSDETNRLTYRTTVLSSVLALVGVALGAYLTYLLT
jgi:hypothetical protein